MKKYVLILSLIFISTTSFAKELDLGMHKIILLISFCVLVSCQSPYEIKKNSSNNLKNMNVTTEGKIKSK